MKSYYNCNFFDSKFIDNCFEVTQDVLVFDSILKNEKLKFFKKQLIYKCEFNLSKEIDKEKPVVIIPIRDNRNLLEFTLKNLVENDILNHCNIVIVDDRSKEKISTYIGEKFSILRIDTDSGFNFSMLNNIPAKIFYDLGFKEIILWNSDLWCFDNSTIPNLIKKHRDLDSTITGTKLIYPPIEMSLNKEVDSQNIIKIFPGKTNGEWRNTVQFGGDFYSSGFYHHYGRFKDPNDFRINCNRPASFITGAFQIINLKHFIELGGLNPSLSANYQDNDFCLKVIESGKKIYYCGKDCALYHDESATLHENKVDSIFLENQILFSKIWSKKIGSLI